MSQTKAPVSGGVLTILGGAPQQLSSDPTPCRHITIRSHIGNSEASIGHSDVNSGTRWAFMFEGETYTIGPFGPGIGIRPCDIYLLGTTWDAFTWGGFHS